jgi:hypothetical protein
MAIGGARTLLLQLNGGARSARAALVAAERHGLAVCLTLFGMARVAYWATGGGFSTAMLNASYQLLDV